MSVANEIELKHEITLPADLKYLINNPTIFTEFNSMFVFRSFPGNPLVINKLLYTQQNISSYVGDYGEKGFPQSLESPILPDENIYKVIHIAYSMNDDEPNIFYGFNAAGTCLGVFIHYGGAKLPIKLGNTLSDFLLSDEQLRFGFQNQQEFGSVYDAIIYNDSLEGCFSKKELMEYGSNIQSFDGFLSIKEELLYFDDLLKDKYVFFESNSTYSYVPNEITMAIKRLFAIEGLEDKVGKTEYIMEDIGRIIADAEFMAEDTNRFREFKYYVFYMPLIQRDGICYANNEVALQLYRQGFITEERLTRVFNVQQYRGMSDNFLRLSYTTF